MFSTAIREKEREKCAAHPEKGATAPRTVYLLLVGRGDSDHPARDIIPIGELVREDRNLFLEGNISLVPCL